MRGRVYVILTLILLPLARIGFKKHQVTYGGANEKQVERTTEIYGSPVNSLGISEKTKK